MIEQAIAGPAISYHYDKRTQHGADAYAQYSPGTNQYSVSQHGSNMNCVSPTSPAPSSLNNNAVDLHRENTQDSGAPPAYEDDAHYVDVQREVKTAPVIRTLAYNPSESPSESF